LSQKYTNNFKSLWNTKLQARFLQSFNMATSLLFQMRMYRQDFTHMMKANVFVYFE
jgi:hypothetical protein